MQQRQFPPLTGSDRGNPGGFRSRLEERIAATGTCLCLGIDPHIEPNGVGLPSFFQQDLLRRGVLAFLSDYVTTLLEAAKGIVPAVKLQSAFFEAFGSEGWGVLTSAVRQAHDLGFLVILDAKRGDIASTMAAYGRMAFETLKADALTITPYIGLDVVEPLAPWLRAGCGAFVVWISSNAGGHLVQEARICEDDRSDLMLAERIFYAMQSAAIGLGIERSLGWVLGATRVDVLDAAWDERLKNVPILMPGLGAQGGALSPRIISMLASRLVLVPQSRSLAGFVDGLSNWNDYMVLVHDRVCRAAKDLTIPSGN